MTFGTVASANAKSSFAPCLMMPPYSWSVPGKKPGTSTNVTSGMLKQSQKRTKRAAFIEASMSSTPARTLRLVRDDADGRGRRCGRSRRRCSARTAGDLEEVAVVDDGADDVLHVVRLVRRSGMTCRARAPRACGSSSARTSGGSSWLFGGRNERSAAPAVEAVVFVGGDEMADAALRRVRGGAAELFLRHLLVGHRLDDLGAGDEHLRVPSTIRMKSVIAGEYTAPPAHGPMIKLICGTTPLACMLRQKMSA